MKSVSFYNKDFFVIKTGNSALAESIERILMTSPGERINNPNFGCRLKESIFNFESYLREDIILDVVKSINRWEPRATVNNTAITKMDQNTFKVDLDITNNDTGQSFSISTILNT